MSNFSQSKKEEPNKLIKGKKMSKETKQKIRNAILGIKRSSKTKEKISLSRRGIKLSHETKHKIRIARLGKKLSEETKRKISRKNKGKSKPVGFGVGRIFPEEVKDKIRNSLFKKDSKNRLIKQYRYIAQKSIGRELLKNEIVHHLDGNFRNNELGNLRVMTREEHLKLHAKQQGFGKITNHLSKINPNKKKEIISLKYKNAKDIAKKYNVSEGTIFKIWRNAGVRGYKCGRLLKYGNV